MHTLQYRPQFYALRSKCATHYLSDSIKVNNSLRFPSKQVFPASVNSFVGLYTKNEIVTVRLTNLSNRESRNVATSSGLLFALV